MVRDILLAFHKSEWHTVVMMITMGFLGGAVRVCNGDQKRVRSMMGTCMVSGMSGGIIGAVLHSTIKDPIYLSALSAVAGYMGQLGLVVVTKFVQGKLNIKVDINVQEPHRRK